MTDRRALRYAAAALPAVPIGALAWFEFVYLWFGVTGDDPPRMLSAGAAVAAFSFGFLWPLRSTERPAAVITRSCRLGIALAILLPIVSIAVLLLWTSASGRRDLGMGGLMLYSLPVVALILSAVLVAVFALTRRFAAARLGADGA